MSALSSFKDQREYEEWLLWMQATHGATIPECNEALHKSKTPREAETAFKISKAATAVKGYATKKIILPSFGSYKVTHDKEYATCYGCGPTKDGMCLNCQLPLSAAGKASLASAKKGPAPDCTCDVKLLFSQGCCCEYSKWKKK